MIRLIYMFFYLCGYLIYSLPNLHKMKKKAAENNAKDDPVIHTLPKKWARDFLRNSGAKVEVSGIDEIPEGPVLFVGNHEGDFDVPVLLGHIPKPFGFISKIEVKKIPVVAGWMETMGCIFIDRNDRRASVKSIRDGIQKLNDGHSVLVFPEGTRNRGKEMAEFKGGSLRLAKDAAVPIVPFMIQGTSDLLESNGNRIKTGTVKLVILPPVPPSDYTEKGMQTVADEIRDSINKKREEILKER